MRTLLLLMSLAGAARAADCSLEIVDGGGMPGPHGPSRQDVVCKSADAALLRKLIDAHGAAFEGRLWINVGPDAEFRRIRLACGGMTLSLSSWHPLTGPKHFAGAAGIRSLSEGETPAKALAAEPADYRAKFTAFDAIVAGCRRAASIAVGRPR